MGLQPVGSHAWRGASTSCTSASSSSATCTSPSRWLSPSPNSPPGRGAPVQSSQPTCTAAAATPACGEAYRLLAATRRTQPLCLGPNLCCEPIYAPKVAALCSPSAAPCTQPATLGASVAHRPRRAAAPLRRAAPPPRGRGVCPAAGRRRREARRGAAGSARGRIAPTHVHVSEWRWTGRVRFLLTHIRQRRTSGSSPHIRHSRAHTRLPPIHRVTAALTQGHSLL